MEVLWYIITAGVLIMFFVLDGYDFGTGIIHLFFAKKEEDRKVVAKAAGLFWDSNEVWLVVAGGMLFMAFPTYYASVFSGFYLPLIIVLWLIIFRAIGLELRSQLDSSMWRRIWDTSFGVSSLLLALFFGIALGNIARGVNLGEIKNGQPVYEGHLFFLPLWDNTFSPLSHTPGVIDWFTLIIGLIAVVALTIHGANWIILKTKSSINEKLKHIIYIANFILLGLTVISIIALLYINPNGLNNFIERPYFLVFPLIFIIGVVGLFFRKKIQNDYYAFILSTMIIVGGISGTLAALSPVILPSTNSASEPLTIYNTAAPAYELSVAVYWGIVGFILMIIYAIVQKRLLSGKIDDVHYGH
ncbi:MAG: cytochrome d ubiquinol oxidase subunit II [Weeksellaceae bacterium]